MKSLTQSTSEKQVSYYPKQVVGTKITCSSDVYSVLKDFYAIETIGKMLGHSTLKHTQIYAKAIASKFKSDMQRVKELMIEF